MHQKDPCLTRRQFTRLAATVLPLAALASALPKTALAGKVDEASPQARALNYVVNSSKPTQICGNCTLYQGKPGKAAGPCPLFSGESVNVTAWCSAWVPRG